MTDLCQCSNPFCGEEHAAYVPSPIGPDETEPDEWEGPQGPEYSEYDAEAYDEMVWQDEAGMS